MDFVALTTSIPRLEIHKIVYPSFLNFWRGFSVKWFVNLNNFNNLPREDDLDYLASLRSESLEICLCANNRNSGRESFFKACIRLFNLSKDLQPRIGFLWLEDDWVFNKDQTITKYVEHTTPESHVSFYGRDRLSFNPAFWGQNGFLENFSNLLNTKSNNYMVNPEKAVCSPAKKKTKEIKKFVSFPITSEIGREWQKEHFGGKRTFS